MKQSLSKDTLIHFCKTNTLIWIEEKFQKNPVAGPGGQTCPQKDNHCAWSFAPVAEWLPYPLLSGGLGFDLGGGNTGQHWELFPQITGPTCKNGTSKCGEDLSAPKSHQRGASYPLGSYVTKCVSCKPHYMSIIIDDWYGTKIWISFIRNKVIGPPSTKFLHPPLASKVSII